MADFLLRRHLARSERRLRLMAARKTSLEETQPALENVGPGVGDYAGAQIAPPSHQCAIKNTQRHDYHHLLPTLISVHQPEDRSLQNHCCNDAARHRAELLLQVTAKN